MGGFSTWIAGRMEAGRQKAKQDEINAKRTKINQMIADSYVPGEATPFVDEEANFMAESLTPQEHEQIDFQGSAPGLVASQEPGYIDYNNAFNEMAQQGYGLEAMELRQGMSKGVSQPNAVREYQFYNSLEPGERENYLRVKRAQQIRDFGGNLGAIDLADPTKVQNIGRKTLPPAQTIPYIEEKAKTQQRIAMEGKKMAAKPKATLALGQAEQRTSRLKAAIKKATGQASAWNTGIASGTAAIAGTPAYDLSQTLQTVKANIGFDALNAMRQSSPTGGALGQVSERELGYLQSVLSSLEQAQSSEQLKENLGIAESQIEESWKRIAEAYRQDYGKPMPGQQEEKPPVRFKSYAQKGDQKIGSNDGNTWFDVKTGKRIR